VSGAGSATRRAAVTATALLTLGMTSACSHSGPDVVPPTAAPTTADTAGDASSNPTATEPTGPLSPFEKDPGVKVLRRHYAGLAEAVNAKNPNIADLTQTSTKARAARHAQIIKPDLGLHYPGPIPFTPLATSVTGSTEKVAMCVISDGWAVNPTTGAPAHPEQVLRLTATLVKHGGAWRVDSIVRVPGSCAGVQIAEVKF
jgi:hypothetical protein